MASEEDDEEIVPKVEPPRKKPSQKKPSIPKPDLNENTVKPEKKTET